MCCLLQEVYKAYYVKFSGATGILPVYVQYALHLGLGMQSIRVPGQPTSCSCQLFRSLLIKVADSPLVTAAYIYCMLT